MGGISFTHEKKDVDLGPVQIQHKQKDTLPISPILNTIALIAALLSDCWIAGQVGSVLDHSQV
jgi:hypothetical protein